MTQLYPEPIDKLVAHLCDLVCHYSRIHDMLTGEGSLGDFANQPDGVLFHLLADVKVDGRSEDTGTVDGMDWAEEPRIGTVDWSPC